jgi:hypothetical protein
MSYYLGLLISTLVSVLYYCIIKNSIGRQMFPDSQRYWHAGGGNRLYGQFNLRWLLPFICRQNEKVWEAVTQGSVILLAPALYFYLVSFGLSVEQGLLGSALVCGLSGVYIMNYIGKYLNDATGMLFMLLSAGSFYSGYWELSILFSAVGSCVKESVFVYSAIAGMNPLALLGGVVVLIRKLFWKPASNDLLGDWNHEILDHPFKTGWKWHKDTFTDWTLMLAPWGLVLLFGLVGMWNVNTLQIALMLGISYLTVFMATDTVRLYQWAFPVVVASAVTVIPLEWSIPVILIQWFISFKAKYI